MLNTNDGWKDGNAVPLPPYAVPKRNQHVFLDGLPTEILLAILSAVDVLSIDDTINNMFFVNKKFADIITDHLATIYRKNLQRNHLVEYCFVLAKFQEMKSKDSVLTERLIRLVATTFTKVSIDVGHSVYHPLIEDIVKALAESNQLEYVHFYRFGRYYAQRFVRQILERHPQCTVSYLR